MEKTLEEISDAFNTEIPIGSLVRVVLTIGLGVEYDEKHKQIKITKPELEMGMKKPELEGYFLEFSSYGSPDDPSLEFETECEYCFTLRCSQIDDYEVLEEPE